MNAIMPTPAQQAKLAFLADPASQAPGLSIDLFIGSRISALTLEHIPVTAPASPLTGVGSKALRALLSYADLYGVTIDLEVGYDASGIDLIAWYSRHGFVWREGYMERMPLAPEPAPAPDEDLGRSGTSTRPRP